MYSTLQNQEPSSLYSSSYSSSFSWSFWQWLFDQKDSSYKASSLFSETTPNRFSTNVFTSGNYSASQTPWTTQNSAAKPTLESVSNKILSKIFTRENGISLLTGVGTKMLLSTALTPLGLGAFAGVSLSLYRSIKGNWDSDKGIIRNIGSTLSKFQTWKKAGISAAFATVGVLGVDVVGDLLVSEAYADTLVSEGSTPESNVPPATSTIEEPTKSMGEHISVPLEESTQTSSLMCERVLTEDDLAFHSFPEMAPPETDSMRIVIEYVTTPPEVEPDPYDIQSETDMAPLSSAEMAAFNALSAQENISEVIDANLLLNGKAIDDMALVQEFVTAAKEVGGIDAEALQLVEEKMASGADFISTADSVQVVAAYSEALQTGLEDGTLTSDEYRNALGKMFTQLSTSDFIVDVEGQIDDTEIYEAGDKLAAIKSMTDINARFALA